MKRRLLLFDIDGTLLLCGPRVCAWICAALSETFGREAESVGYAYSGKTDDRIFRELAMRAGVAREVVERGLPEVRRRYLEALEAGLEAEEMTLLPGVHSLLERLADRKGVTLALLTGNWEPAARTRLARFDLNRYFPFGAFSEGQVDRSDLVPVALERAEAAVGHRFEPSEVLIIGDSPLDVLCAKAHGIPCLAVATGHATAEELATAGADRVCHNLQACETLLGDTWIA